MPPPDYLRNLYKWWEWTWWLDVAIGGKAHPLWHKATKTVLEWHFWRCRYAILNTSRLVTHRASGRKPTFNVSFLSGPIDPCRVRLEDTPRGYNRIYFEIPEDYLTKVFGAGQGIHRGQLVLDAMPPSVAWGRWTYVLVASHYLEFKVKNVAGPWLTKTVRRTPFKLRDEEAGEAEGEPQGDEL